MAANWWDKVTQGVSNWWDDVTGKKQKDAGAATQAAGNTTMGTAAKTLGGIAAQDPAKQAAAAQQAGAAQGEQMGRTAATAGAQTAAQSARTSGLNAGQAALMGSQQAGQLFTQGQQTGQQMGQQSYSDAAGRQITAATGQGAIGQGQASSGATQAAAGQQQNKDFWGGVSGLATSALGLFSDERLKEDVTPTDSVDEAARSVDGKDFHYKGEGGAKETGVMAQDLEKVAPRNVKDTPAGKVVDTGRQTMTNTAWITELARRVRRLEGKGA